MGEPLTSLPPLTRLRHAPSSVAVFFSLAVLRVGRPHYSAFCWRRLEGNISAQRSNPRAPSVAAVRNAVGPSVRRYAHAPQAARSAEDIGSTGIGAAGGRCARPRSGRGRRRLPIEAACLQPRLPVRPLCFSLAAVFRARAFQILIDGGLAVLCGKRGFHVHGLSSAFDAP